MAANPPQPLEDVADQEDIQLTITMTTVGDITSDTFKAVLVTSAGTVVATKTLGSGISVITSGGDSSYGVIRVSFDAADIHAAGVGDAKYEVWRTSTGRQARLAYGPCPIEQEYAI